MLHIEQKIKTPDGEKAIGKLKVDDRVLSSQYYEGKILSHERVKGLELYEYEGIIGCGDTKVFRLCGWKSFKELGTKTGKTGTCVAITISPLACMQTAQGLTIHNGGGKSSRQPSTTTQHTAPPKYIEPYHKELAKLAKRGTRGVRSLQTDEIEKLGAQGEKANYQRPLHKQTLYAPQNKTQKQATAGVKNTAGSWLEKPGVTKAGTETRKIANLFSDGNLQNDALKNALTAQHQNTNRLFNQSVLPQLGGTANAAGAYGGSRHGIAEALAAQSLAQQQSLVNAQATWQNEQAVRARQAQAPQLYSQARALDLQPYQIQGGAGLQEQQWAQAQHDTDFFRRQLEEQSHFRGLPEYNNLLQLGSGSGGTSTLQTPQQGSLLGGPIGGAIGGGLLGYGLHSAGFLPGGAAGALATGPAAPIVLGGALLGGLAGGIL